jgi:hypothetical protein
VGIAAQSRLVETNGTEHFSGARAVLAPGFAAVDDHGLADNLLDGHPRVEGAIGILKDDLHIATEAAEVGARGSQHVAAIKADAAGVGFDEAEQHAAEGALAGARFADQADSLAGFNREGNVIHGPNAASGHGPEGALARGECLDQVFSLHQQHVGDGNKLQKCEFQVSRAAA